MNGIPIGGIPDGFPKTHTTRKVYRLERTIANPKPDRRKQYDWTAFSNLHNGSRFEVETVRLEALPGLMGQPIEVIRGMTVPGCKNPQAYSVSESQKPELFAALRAALVPLEEENATLEDVLKMHDSYEGEVLRLLLKKGVVSLATIKQVLTERE